MPGDAGEPCPIGDTPVNAAESDLPDWQQCGATAEARVRRAAKEGDAAAMNWMGNRCAETGRPAHAEAWYRHAVSAGPGESADDALVNLGLLLFYERGQPRLAAHYLRRYRESASGRSMVHPFCRMPDVWDLLERHPG